MPGIDIRFPNITATTTDGKMSQMQSYMHQLVEQLNWALSTVDNAIQGNTSNVVVASQKAQNSEENAVDTFNSLKALIIKSADLVKVVEDVASETFSGEYVAVSDFGEYKKETDAEYKKTSKYAEDAFNAVETIGEDVRTTNAYIRRGELGTYKNGDLKGQTAYGIAIGETQNGVFTGYAWFTASRLSFFDEYGNEVAYVSSNRLYITGEAVFLGNVQFGNYKADTSDGLAFVWIGG